MGRVQSGKTGHQLGMLAWAADKCDVAVIFTGVTEALNGQTSYRISKDLGTLPSNPVATLNVPTRANAEPTCPSWRASSRGPSSDAITAVEREYARAASDPRFHEDET